MTLDNRYCSPWYLRRADGKTYGPVSLDVLLSWAAQARVGPGTQVSFDGTTWVAPETIPGLELEWMILVRNRSPYGPLNRLGAVQLARDGVIAPDTRVINTKTLQEVRISELMTDIFGLIKCRLM